MPPRTSRWTLGPRARGVLGALLLGAAILLDGASVRAQLTGEPATQADWVARASELEAAARPVDARAAWQRAVELDPGSRLARRAERRLEWLDAHSEGAFGPLTALWGYQRLPEDARSASDVEALERAMGAMPAGRVRAEAAVSVADAWSRRGETERALGAYRALEADPFLDEGERSMIAEEVARVYAGAGRLDEAIAELEASGSHGSSSVRALARASRRRVLEPVAWSIVALFALALVLSIARSRGRTEVLRAAVAPGRLALAAALALGPLGIALTLGDEASVAFEGLAVVVVLSVLGSGALGEALARARAPERIAGASLGALATLAGAYLAVAYLGRALPFG